MKHAIIIAAVFILATIAVAILSPFDHPPQRSLEPAAAAQAPSDDGSADEPSYDDSSSSGGNSSSNIGGSWNPGEAPPP